MAQVHLQNGRTLFRNCICMTSFRRTLEGPESLSLLFFFWREACVWGRDGRDHCLSPGLETAGSCLCLAAPHVTRTVDGQQAVRGVNEDRGSRFICLRIRATAQEAENLMGLS